MKCFYSAANNGFYNDKDFDHIPDDSIEISQELINELLLKQSIGQVICAGVDGYPTAIDKPPLSQDEYIAIADIEKSQRLVVAKETIDPLSDAVDFDEATDEEIEKLKLWKKYRLALTRIDTSTAPDIEWPTVP